MSDQTVMSIEDFMSAGLETEGIYRLQVKDLKVREFAAKDGSGTYKSIVGNFLLVERLGDGLIDSPARVSIFFNTTGKGLERFRNLYIAALGVPSETDAGSVTLEDLAAALEGNASVWSQYYHKRNYKDAEIIEGVLGWDFSTEPGNIKAPRSFAERDAA